mmetsp:Transcript_35815/g.93978  ORF Transcript_35815/g.93978 Transcript_35815/m.93978 type:complete len:88 (-) Transcript_35815:96-359(-)
MSLFPSLQKRMALLYVDLMVQLAEILVELLGCRLVCHTAVHYSLELIKLVLKLFFVGPKVQVPLCTIMRQFGRFPASPITAKKLAVH